MEVVEISGDRIRLLADEFAFAEIMENGTLVAECPVDKTSPIRLVPFPIVIESEQKVVVLSLELPI
jgi:hypothetical protein